jgi:hypothetical protein
MTAAATDRVDTAEIIAWLRASQGHFRPKHSQRWVKIPKALVFNVPSFDQERCVACRLGVPSGLAVDQRRRGIGLDDLEKHLASIDAGRGADNSFALSLRQLLQPQAGKPFLSDPDRSKLVRGRGLTLKTLLTIYRWARPYVQAPLDADSGWYEHQATALLSLERMAFEVFGSALSAYDPAPSIRAVRRSIRMLQDLHVLALVEDRGRGRANFYAGHAVEPFIEVPTGLWRQGWILRLSGGGLLTLLRLFGRQQEARLTPDVWRRMTPPARVLAERGTLITPTETLLGTDVQLRSIRSGIAELERLAAIADVRVRRGRADFRPSRGAADIRAPTGVLSILLDPELLRAPAAFPYADGGILVDR